MTLFPVIRYVSSPSLFIKRKICLFSGIYRVECLCPLSPTTSHCPCHEAFFERSRIAHNANAIHKQRSLAGCCRATDCLFHSTQWHPADSTLNRGAEAGFRKSLIDLNALLLHNFSYFFTEYKSEQRFCCTTANK